MPRRHAGPAMAVGVAMSMWLATGAAAPAAAQEPAAQPAAAAPAEAPEDVFDLLRRIRGKAPPPPPSGPAPADAWDPRKRMLTIMPTIGAKPSTGFTFGAASSVAVYYGDPATTPISSAVVSASVSTKEQIVFGAKFGASTANDAAALRR